MATEVSIIYQVDNVLQEGEESMDSKVTKDRLSTRNGQ